MTSDDPEVERDLYWSFGEYNIEKERLGKFKNLIFWLVTFVAIAFFATLLFDPGELDLGSFSLFPLAIVYWNARRSYYQLNMVRFDESGLRVEPLGLFIPISRIKSIDRVHGGKPFLKVVLSSPMVLLYFGVWATGTELRIAVE